MSNLRDRVIRTAFANPDLRPHLLPLLGQSKRASKLTRDDIPDEVWDEHNNQSDVLEAVREELRKTITEGELDDYAGTQTVEGMATGVKRSRSGDPAYDDDVDSDVSITFPDTVRGKIWVTVDVAPLIRDLERKLEGAGYLVDLDVKDMIESYVDSISSSGIDIDTVKLGPALVDDHDIDVEVDSGEYDAEVDYSVWVDSKGDLNDDVDVKIQGTKLTLTYPVSAGIYGEIDNDTTPRRRRR